MTATAKNKLLEVPAQPPQDSQAKLQGKSVTWSEVHLRLLSLLEKNPAWTQCQIADTLRVSLGKTNYCLNALREKDLIMWGNFSQNLKKLQYINLLTPKDIAQKLSQTTHFLQRKEREFEELANEIARLREEPHENNTIHATVKPTPGETAQKFETVDRARAVQRLTQSSLA
jgi:EPS-associated MarR family transcriptional regulator